MVTNEHSNECIGSTMGSEFLYPQLFKKDCLPQITTGYI